MLWGPHPVIAEGLRLPIDVTSTPDSAGLEPNLELIFTLANHSMRNFPETRLTILDAGNQVFARTERRPGAFPVKRIVEADWGGIFRRRLPAILTISYGSNKVYTQAMPLRLDEAADSAGSP